MPESERFMFGTAWSNWSWWQPNGNDDTPTRCEENHYFLLSDATTWVANGGVGVGITSDSDCTGCSNTYDIENYWYNVSTETYTYSDTDTSDSGRSTSTSGGNSINININVIDRMLTFVFLFMLQLYLLID